MIFTKPLLASLFFSLPLAAEVDFNDHIQPILSKYCYQCHGPDSSSRLPENEPLRLDREDDAFAPRKDGEPVIIKGKAADSQLYKRITNTKPDSIMPPPESHLVLPREDIALLKKWINEGAPYEKHWSFIPPTRPEKPTLDEKNTQWSDTPINNFIAAKLAENKLRPNPKADPARFYRRLHFDLTGLPPTPEESENFSFDNLNAEIDRLLATDASAEHLARQWLDVARYADTHGIHIDNYRSIWPYRDWVIKAFKKNMPFDQFVIEQMAGDLLPDPTLDQLVATGFQRCMPTTGEGGAIPEEYKNVYALDQTTTTGTAFLGLTMGCAACHDHKFDPITQKDTYSFNAFFRNTTMSALDGNQANHPPNVFVPLKKDRERYTQLNQKITQARKNLAERKKSSRADFQKWLPTASLDQDSSDLDPTLNVHLPLNAPAEAISGTIARQAREWPAKFPVIDAPRGQAPVISEGTLNLGDHASFTRSDQVTYGGFIYIEGSPTGAVIARMNPDKNFRGWDLYLKDGKPVAHIIDSWPKAANKIVAAKKLPQKSWHHVMLTFDGTQAGHQTTKLYIDGKHAAAALDPNSVGGNIVANVPLRLGSRAGNDSKLRGGKVALQDFRFYRRLLNPAEIMALANNKKLQDILATPAAKRNQEQKDNLYSYYLGNADPAYRELTRKLAKSQSELDSIKSRGSDTLIMEEKKDSQPFAHILIRGDYSKKGEKVNVDTPEFLFPLPEGAPHNRLGLAKWLVDRQNPLTARVTMNRLWAYLYGTGIVETVGNFGVMGARPSHTKLLDWLAVEFMDSGWDYQHMIKLITSSAAYRQSEKMDSLKLEADPDNRLISRGPRYRLDAEEIRDMALSTSDLLVKKIGGPSVKPYQPDGVWSAVAMPQSNTRNYQQDKGQKLYRRSPYTFWKRTAPAPAMEILNAPSRQISCVRRDLTNTPLQAFVTMNDPQFVEASRRLAEHALKSGDNPDARLDFITKRLLARKLRPAERELVMENLKNSRKIIEKNPDSPAKIISEGESKADPTLDPLELAAWTITTSQILNLDETLTK